MVKSRRSKIVHLTKVTKKGKEHKEKLMEQIQDASGKFESIWVFRVENMRNLFIKKVRLDFIDSKFFVGRNKVMAKALGKDQNEELLQGVHELSRRLSGDIGLMFTNEPAEKVQGYMESLCELDYARAGCKAPETIVIKGEDCPLRDYETEELIPATAETQLRAAGLPSQLRGGHIMLTKDSYQVCEKGENLSSDQCKLLKLLGYRLAHFRIRLTGHYTGGKYTHIEEA